MLNRILLDCDASNSPKLHCFQKSHKQSFTISKLALSTCSPGLMALNIGRPRLNEEPIGQAYRVITTIMRLYLKNKKNYL